MTTQQGLRSAVFNLFLQARVAEYDEDPPSWEEFTKAVDAYVSAANQLPQEAAVEQFARELHEAESQVECEHHNVCQPRWFALREDLKEEHRSRARVLTAREAERYKS